jgi:RNA polymerase sigma-70 factor (ECF subfamily)
VKVVAREDSDALDDAGTSFHQRFEAIRPRLISRCEVVVGRDDAEDVVQESYLRARDRIGQLRNPDAFEAWVTRIALNEARSVARRRATYQERLGERDRIDHGRDRDVALVELVESLPIQQRMAIVLYYGYGYGLAEVARLIGTSHINARTLLLRGRRRLRKEWEVPDDQPPR